MDSHLEIARDAGRSGGGGLQPQSGTYSYRASEPAPNSLRQCRALLCGDPRNVSRRKTAHLRPTPCASSSPARWTAKRSLSRSSNACSTSWLARLLPILHNVSSQMRALRKSRSLPQEIWTGTGGYWPSRIIGLEIMRRGGIVRRFDHGYNHALNRFIEQAVFVEAMVSTHFVFVSEDCARRWRKEPVGELVSPGAVPQFESLPAVQQARQCGSKSG